MINFIFFPIELKNQKLAKPSEQRLFIQFIGGIVIIKENFKSSYKQLVNQLEFLNHILDFNCYPSFIHCRLVKIIRLNVDLEDKLKFVNFYFPFIIKFY